jgi:predicted transcriptional regulator
VAETTMTIRLDEDLKEAFSEVAEAGERTAAQLLRLLMRREVEAARDADAHDEWFRDAVGVGLAELDDPATELVDHADVRSAWQTRRARLERRTTA